MRRRDVLRGAVGLVGTAGVTTVTGRSTNVRTGYEPYGPLGRVGVDGATEAVVGGDGATVYVAATTGFATVDVSDPTDPTVLTERRDLLADREDGPMTGIHDVKVEGDRLLVAGPADHGRSEVTGVLVYDVADPAAPRQVSFLPTSDHVHNCFLHGGIAYYPQGSANQRLEVADVSGEDPTPVATWDPTVHDATWTDVDGSHRTVHDVWVQDGRAYLATWDAGTFVLDVADPRDPSFLARVGGRPMDELRDPARGSRIQPPGNHHYVQVSEDGSLLVIGVESWNVENEAGGGPGGVHLWDISSLTDPRQRSTVEPHRARDETYSSGTWTTSHNFELSGGRLYTSWYQGGVRIHDVSDPEAPEQLAAWRDHREAAFWTARTAGEDVFVASSTAATRALSGLYEGLYTFPDRAGEQADPPAIPSPTPSATPTASPTGGDTPTPTPTPTETPSPTPSPTPTPNPVVGDGFGPLAGLAAVLGAAWWRRRD